MERFDYCVVIPVFNSEATLKPLFDRLNSLFESLGKTFHVVFVDDDSTDLSWKTIVELKAEHPTKVKAIQLTRNVGQQIATLCGIQHNNSNDIITIDDDLQIPPEEIRKLINKYEETNSDLVYGIFDQKKHSIIRNAGSWFVQKFFGYFANTSGKGSSFRLISRNVTDNLSVLYHKYLLLDEVLNWYTDKVAYQEVEHKERKDGRSGYSLIKLFIITVNYVIYYTIIPLRIMTYVGFFFSIISFVIGVFYIYNRLQQEVELGFTSIIVAIFFSTSIVLFSLGIIGEYISRIYVKETSKPLYSIKEIQ